MADRPFDTCHHDGDTNAGVTNCCEKCSKCGHHIKACFVVPHAKQCKGTGDLFGGMDDLFGGMDDLFGGPDRVIEKMRRNCRVQYQPPRRKG